MEHWYENDWLISFMAALSLMMAVVANYYMHGGHISW